MKPTLYLETSIISYLAAWPSRDLVTAARQQIPRDWWENRAEDFDLFLSEIVIDECSAGDPHAAKRRLELTDRILLLDPEGTEALTEALMHDVRLPERAAADALYIAIAVIHGMDYLLTWNCTHIANAALRTRIDDVCRSMGYEPAIICTPEELLSE
ncbi:MAG: type II toxin-antitoxin system VapC family toxin [Planctomycetaceae bacterium]